MTMKQLNVFLLSFLLVLPSSYSISATRTTTTLITPSGTINRSQETASITTPKNGIISILLNPSSYFSSSEEKDGKIGVSASIEDDVLILSCPGASILPSASASNLERGSGGIAAISSLSKSLILTGVTKNDCSGNNGLGGTRHGRNLGVVFGGRMGGAGTKEKTLLIIAVEGSKVTEGMKERVTEDVKAIFDVEWLGRDVSDDGEDKSLTDFYDLEIVGVETEDDVKKVLDMAKSTAPHTSTPNTPVLPLLSSSYTPMLPPNSHEPICVTASMLTCQDSYSRLSKSFFSKILSWNYRVHQRNLTVDKFGTNAELLLKKTLEAFDKDTLSVCGTAVSSYRMEMRSKLFTKMQAPLRELFNAQVGILSKNTNKKFQSALLKELKAQNPSATTPQPDNSAVLLRNAAFTFDNIINDLELPTLSLKKNKHTLAMQQTLQKTLVDFPDSPMAKLLALAKIEKQISNRKETSPKKKPSEKSLDIGLGLVAMIRPDGFGNLQGFTGYSMGSHTVTVGVHNDADAPETISQFGGVRPPLLRIQPKLNFDVEL